MTTIHALIERGGPQACVLIGLYEDRAHAIDVATSHAQHRLARFLDADRRILGHTPESLDYVVTHHDVGEVYQVGLVYRPAGESDSINWIVDTREIIVPPPVVQADLVGLFANAGGAS